MAEEEKKHGTDIGVVVIEGLCNQPLHSSLRSRSRSSSRPADDLCASVYLGETLKYDIVVKGPSDLDLDLDLELPKSKSDLGTRSRARSSSLWRKHISKICSQAFISAIERPNNCIETRCQKEETDFPKFLIEDNDSHGILCHILATFVGNSFSWDDEDNSRKPYFRDENTYVIPMSTAFQDVSGDCQIVELRVVLQLYKLKFVALEQFFQCGQQIGLSDNPLRKKIPVDVHGLFKATDDGEDDSEHCVSDTSEQAGIQVKGLNFSPVKVSNSQQTMQEKTVVTRLKVQGPPELRMRHSCAGQKQLILLTVTNKTEKQMVMKSVQMLSNSTPIHDVSVMYEEGLSVKWESCHQLINLEYPKRNHAFPVILCPQEKMNFIYRLHLSSVPTDSELSLRANVKWTHAGAMNEITTVYKLPRIKIRCPLFIVTVKCDDEVEPGKMFFVNYWVSNQLHDFMSMKLYYNLDNICCSLEECGGSEKEIKRVHSLKDSIVCHDPETVISSCPQGSCVPIRVGFQAHKPGVYELSELMKLNLRYSLLDTQLSPFPEDRESRSNSSDGGVSFHSTDDHLLASEELWRGRSGSTASLATPVMFLSAEERRRSFAAKSYSFGDMGPTVSADSDKVENIRYKVFKRSSAVPPSRPTPPKMLSQTERELIQPSNFLKQPFFIYLKDPLVNLKEKEKL